MVELLNYLGVKGNDLLLRPYGEKAFPVIERELESLDPGQTLVLDFSGINVMDLSFGDETVLELALGLQNGKYGDRFLVLDNPGSATIDNLEGTIARRKVKVALLVRENGSLQIIGGIDSDLPQGREPIERNLLEAWKIVRERDMVTARELADQLNLEISAASMRLHKLHDLRLLARDEEVTSSGRQHVYRLPV
jgi:hypothetical protein